MNIPLGGVVYFDFITNSPTTGAASDADSTPTFAVYENATDTDMGFGGNATKRTGLTGNYRISFTCSALNGFELDKWYNVIASATVSGVAAKAVIKTFRIVAAENVAGYPIADAMKVNGATQTAGDIYARLGAPAGASMSADIAAVKTDTAAVKLKTDNLPASPAATGDIPSASTVATAVMASVVETGYDVTKTCKLILSALAGKLSGAAGTTVTIRDINDSKNRITATVDSDGNRTAITYDLT
jgi:hypothetical protein